MCAGVRGCVHVKKEDEEVREDSLMNSCQKMFSNFAVRWMLHNKKCVESGYNTHTHQTQTHGHTMIIEICCVR